MGMVFSQPLCEEMIFPLLKGKNNGPRYEVIIFPSTRTFKECLHCQNRPLTFDMILRFQ